ncbi:MAG TPA: hypothetical protein VKV04_18725, partial [Verrucomicrobiae bacterium]|nr:hypothetical protein [Verrucomicrobiae bacterium]
MATNTGMNDTFTITDIGSVPPHTYLGNNTTSSIESDFVQPNDGDIDPQFTTNPGATWTMTPGYYVYEVSSTPSGSVTWTWPPAVDYPHGKRVFFFDKLGLLSRQNPIVFQPTGGDAFNGNNIQGVNITVGVPGSYVIAESDGSSNWSFHVVQQPPATVQMTDFGAFPISIAGDSNCTWSNTNTTVTCPNHTWSAAEIAQINAVGFSNWKVVLQYAGASNAEFITHLGAVPNLLHPHDFTVATLPSQPNAGGPLTQLRVVNAVTVASAGMGYNFGSTWQLSYTGSGSVATPGRFTTKVLKPAGPATITSSGSPAIGTYYCVLAPTSGGALGGINQEFQIMVTGVGFPPSATPVNPTGYYTSLAGYTYDISNGGAFDNVPCTPTTSISGWGSGNIYLNVYMGLYTVQDTFGRDATSGVYLGKIDNGMGKWCGGGAIASASFVSGGGTTDVGTGAGFSCSAQLPLVWVGYDNQTALQSIFTYLNNLIPSQRPCVRINGIFLTTATEYTTGSPQTNFNSIIGKTCWKGETPYLTGFFVMPGSPGDVFPVVDSNGNSAENPNGGNVTDANPDQSGSTFRDFTCWGDPTAVVKPQGCIRFYGLVQRAILENLTADALPGCLVCVGADSNGSGSIAESFFIDFRAAFSGDDSTLTPVVALDSVGATTTGANNNVMLRLRTYKDFYESLAVRPCDGTAGSNNAHLNTF